MGAGIIGAIIGLFLGGPIGAIIGFFIGLACDKGSKKQEKQDKTNSLSSNSSLPNTSSKKQKEASDNKATPIKSQSSWTSSNNSKYSQRYSWEKPVSTNKYQALLDCVSDWDGYGLKHKWFVPYYPYYKHKNSATADMWSDWKFIWNFKNDEGTSYKAHQAALQRAIRLTESALRQAFHQRVHDLTFVCLPASSVSKNQRRFADFSRTVCQDLGMQNGFSHITITADATPKHKGGTGQPQKWYDSNFFQGKYVIIFDDVCTSGKSLKTEKAKLESMGAKVIGAITLAQTQ